MAEFAKLFKTSKIATYDSAIKQVYTAKNKNKFQGDWGLKRTIPIGWKAPIITINAIDSYDRQAIFDNALHDSLVLRRFKINFKNEIIWKGIDYDKKILLQKVDCIEFKEIVKKAELKKKEWLKKEIKTPESLLEFLNLTTSKFSIQINKAPPKYKIDRGLSNRVKGILLHENDRGCYIGVNGIVCRLDYNKNEYQELESTRLSLEPYSLYDFYVDTIDLTGTTPYVRLSLTRQYKPVTAYSSKILELSSVLTTDAKKVDWSQKTNSVKESKLKDKSNGLKIKLKNNIKIAW